MSQEMVYIEIRKQMDKLEGKC